MIHTAMSIIRDMTTPAPAYSGALAEDLAADCLTLQLFFEREGRFLGEHHVDRLHLALSPAALVNLGALVPGSLGRWDTGYHPGPLLSMSPTRSLEPWRECAAQLRPFAIAYRSHPLRNPEDKLDAALSLFDRLSSSNKEAA